MQNREIHLIRKQSVLISHIYKAHPDTSSCIPLFTCQWKHLLMLLMSKEERLNEEEGCERGQQTGRISCFGVTWLMMFIFRAWFCPIFHEISDGDFSVVGVLQSIKLLADFLHVVVCYRSHLFELEYYILWFTAQNQIYCQNYPDLLLHNTS